MEDNKLYKKYILSITIVSLLYIIIVYFVFYKNDLKIIPLINIILELVITVLPSKIGIKVNRRLVTYICIIVFLMLIFTYFCDMKVEYNQSNHVIFVEEDKDSEENEYNELEDKSSYENNVVEIEQTEQGVTISASFLEPSDIEKELLNNEMNYIPVINESIVYDVFELSNKIRSDITDVAEYSFLSYGIIEEKVDSYLHTDEGYSDEMLNTNKEVGNLLKQANEINERIRIHETVSDYLSLMSIYEKAFKLAPCSSISLQLARPYEGIILILPIFSTNDCNKIFEYGLKAIDHFSKTLSYKIIRGSSDSDILYRIAKIYHNLGDLPNLKLDLRKELYMISSAYYELSISNEENSDGYTYQKSYYCAMVNHKLGVISGADNYFYLDKALKYYEKAINHSKIIDYTKYKAYQYMSEICERLVSYINEYGKNEYLKECTTYKDLSIGYKEESYLYNKLLRK